MVGVQTRPQDDGGASAALEAGRRAVRVCRIESIHPTNEIEPLDRSIDRSRGPSPGCSEQSSICNRLLSSCRSLTTHLYSLPLACLRYYGIVIGVPTLLGYDDVTCIISYFSPPHSWAYYYYIILYYYYYYYYYYYHYYIPSSNIDNKAFCLSRRPSIARYIAFISTVHSHGDYSASKCEQSFE